MRKILLWCSAVFALTLSHTSNAQCSVSTFPYLEDFDGASWGVSTTFDPCWTRVSGTPAWTVDNNTTPSSSTGPSADHTGGNYLFLEASSGTAGNYGYVETPYFDLSGLSNPVISFYYHRYGQTMGDMIIQASLDSGATWCTVYRLTGQTQTASTDPWLLDSANLTAVKSTYTKLRFGGEKGSSFYGDMSIDSVAVYNSTSAVCNMPICLANSNVGSSTADITWTSTNSAFDIEYGPAGFTPGMGLGTTTTATSTSITLTGLSPATSYDVYVRSDCSSSSLGTSDWAGPTSFVTSCVTVTSYPYDESFDSTNVWSPTTTYDPCWNITAPSSYRWQVNSGSTGSSSTGPSSDASGSGQYLYTEASSSGGDAIMEMPPFDLTSLTSPELSFKYHMYGQTMSDLYIETSVDTGTSWYTVDSLIGQQHSASSDPWLERIIDVTYAKTAYTLVRIRAVRSTNFYGDASIDDVSMHEAPPCPNPQFFQYFNLMPTTVDVTFVGAGSVYNVEWGLSGFTPGTGTFVSSTNDTISLSNLPAGTCLDFYIQSDCSASGNGTSVWSGPFSFCTPCNAASLPYIQDFNTWPLVCENPSAGTASWQVYGADWARANYWSNNNADFIMEMQRVDVTADARLSFVWSHYRTSPTSYPDDDLAVLARPVDSTNWDTLWYARAGDGNFDSQDGALTTTPGTGIQEIVLLPSHYTGQVVEFVINGHSSWGPDAFVNDFVVEEVPDCLEPLGFNLVWVTDSSAAITWTADTSATTSNVEWGIAGFTPGTSTIYTGTGDSVYLTGLPPATLLDVYVSVDCASNSTSVVSGPFQFRTNCPAYFSAPYSENFSLSTYGTADASLAFENCWTTNTNSSYRWESEDASGANENSSSTGPFYDNTTPTTSGGGYMFTEASFTGSPAELYSPLIELSSLTTPTLEFAYHMYGQTMGTLHVDVWNGSMWVDDVWMLSGEQQTAGSDPFLLAEVPLAAFIGDTIQLRFRGERGSNFYSDMSIDDVSISNGPACSVVSGGFAENITSSAGDLNWSAFSTSDYNIEWGPCGFTPGTGIGTVVTNVAPGYTLSGLNPNTCYEFYVSNNCDASSTQYGPFSFTTACLAQLNGVYTVGGTPGPNNFADLDTAMAALVCGISGPVTYQIVGTQALNGTLTIGEIDGVSNTNTFTIDGLSTGTLTSFGLTPMISIEDAKHVTITGLNIVDSASSAAGIRVFGNSDSITISNNNLLVAPGSTSSASTVIGVTNSLTSMSSTGGDADYITIVDNTVVGSYYGINVMGNSTTVHTTNAVIERNHLSGQYYYGLRVYYYEDVEINDNYIAPSTNTSGGYGGYFYYLHDYNVVGNYIAGRTYGIYAAGLNRYDATANGYWANNMIISDGSTTQSALYITTSCQNLDFYHNSIRSNGYGIRDFSTSNYDFRNNIVVAGNLAIDFSTAPTANDTMDYNLFYNTSGGNLAEYPAACADLAALQAAQSGYNTNSVSADPIFVTNDDLHLTGSAANDVGDNSVGVAEDYDGDVRPASGSTVVDMGADEYTPLLWDAEMMAIYEPGSGGCGDSNVVVSVIVRNLGLNDITSLDVFADVTGTTTANLNTTYTTTIPSAGMDTIVVGTFNIYNGGSVSVDAYLSLTNDGDLTNDTAASVSASYISYEPQAVASNDTVCEGDMANLYAVPQPGVIYGWYENTTDTVPVSTGDTLSVTADPNQTTYYLGYVTSGVDSVETTFAGGNSCGGGNMFDLTPSKPLLVEGFVVNTTSSVGTSMTVNVYYVTGGYAGNETNAGAWTLHEAVATVSAGTGNGTRVEFQNPLVLSAGTTYGMFVNFAASYTNGTQTISNSDFTMDLGLGLCGAFSGTNPGRIFNGRMLYRAGNSCSPTKIPVSFTINPAPTAAITHNWVGGNGTGLVRFDATGSTDATDYTWDFGDGNTATGDTVHNIYANGTYYVTLIASNACGSDTIMDTVMIEGIGLNELSGVQSVSLFPNPASANVSLSIEMAEGQDMTLEVVNLQGQVLYTQSLGRVEGEYIWSSDLSALPRGAYFVRLTGETGVKTLPLTLQ
ncbi:PKD domain-containing protein [Phaeocystidibacter marisrubri]|uniref:T9SS type A sorting domain-containing protein n=1 Tax=Phaeocystidibacter marisrubri TaxID=1577780 RepID=A0A6L3ZL29_9FLAO|nr:PKD domain-containing protein [Phaeocystidibacter marisrubri]KAB2818185.1 T9SS type A sorting domain-containing protein [Phaeocystidibacter marisrubri]